MSLSSSILFLLPCAMFDLFLLDLCALWAAMALPLRFATSSVAFWLVLVVLLFTLRFLFVYAEASWISNASRPAQFGHV